MDKESGITRLFKFLANKQVYPVPIVAAATVSGIPANMIKDLLIPDYIVQGNDIYRKEEVLNVH